MKFWLFLWCSAFFIGCSNEVEVLKRPNIILIVTDDQGYGDLGCHGNPWIRTPQMDRLYNQSVRLTDFHVGTTCAPTRAGLLTGRNCNEVGVWHTIMGRNFLRKGEVTIAGILKQHGYRTGIFGKWHLGDNYPYRPQDRGFDEVLIHGGGGVGQTPDYWNNDYFADTYFRNGEPVKYDGYCTDVWFNEAVKFIESNREAPFFCYIATNAPHSPFHVPEHYIELYRNDENVPNANFYGMITNIDENLGMLRRKIEDWNLKANTVLMFMTDNGTSAGVQLDNAGFVSGKGYNARMRGKKGSPFDGGHRVPFFIYWPDGNISGGRDINYIASYTDLVPTLLDLCQIDVDPVLPFEGESLVDILKNPDLSWKSRTIITDTQRKGSLEKWKDAAVMTDQYRLIRGNELYDIEIDPGQVNDVSSQYPEVVLALRQAYEVWWERTSKRSDEISSIPVGHDSETVTLTCHDMHTDDGNYPAWNQEQVRRNKNSNGFWMIDIQKKGQYAIALYRYPVEAGIGFRDIALSGDHIDGGKPYSEGLPIQLSEAGLKIGDILEIREPKSDDRSVVFEVGLEPGEKELRAWLIDEQGEKIGAYYVYVTPI